MVDCCNSYQDVNKQLKRELSGCQLENNLDFLTIFVKNVAIISQIQQQTPQNHTKVIKLQTLTLCAVVFPPKMMSLPVG